jgi:hypothetical protein
MPPSPVKSHAPRGPIQGTQRSQTDNLPAPNADSYVPLPNTQHFNLDTLAKDSIHDKDFDPELLTDNRISCG